MIRLENENKPENKKTFFNLTSREKRYYSIKEKESKKVAKYQIMCQQVQIRKTIYFIKLFKSSKINLFNFTKRQRYSDDS